MVGGVDELYDAVELNDAGAVTYFGQRGVELDEREGRLLAPQRHRRHDREIHWDRLSLLRRRAALMRTSRRY